MKNNDIWIMKVAGGVIICALLLLALVYPYVQTTSIDKVIQVADDGYILIDGYSDVQAEGARVFTTRTGFAIAPVTKDTPVVAIKNGRIRVKVAYGVIKAGQQVPDIVEDDFVDGLEALVRASFSSEYYSYFPVLAKVYRASYSKNFSTLEETRRDIVIESRKVLGFDEPEKDAVMESQFQEFFGPNGTLTKYIYSKYPTDTDWGVLIPQIATAFERVSK